ncbi:unnamed protein product [Lathyrus oleraceus]
MEEEDFNWFTYTISYKIDNGHSIEFWKDKWLGSSSLSIMFPLIFTCASHLKLKVANIWEWMENMWVWNVKLVEDMHLQEEEEAKLDSILSILQDVQLKRHVDDSFVWWRKKNMFSVKDNYQTLEDVFDVDVQVEESTIHHLDMLWITNSPSKIIISKWMLLLNWFPTIATLASRGIISGNHNKVCPFCFAA